MAGQWQLLLLQMQPHADDCVVVIAVAEADEQQMMQLMSSEFHFQRLDHPTSGEHVAHQQTQNVFAGDTLT
jgi:hypothetical protein